MTTVTRSEAQSTRDPRFGLVLVCFALSGFAALLYETAWVKQFAFVFGTSDLAVATVLAAYFGGLTVGAAAAARFTGRIRRPILVYGILELGIAATALAVPYALRACTGVYVAMYGGLDSPPPSAGFSTALFYLICAFVILMAPTAMMGATLPLLAKHSVRSDKELGRRVGLLYAINTGGAVGGTLCAAFVLLPAMGLSRTIWVGVAVNVAVFVLAAWLARMSPAMGTTKPAAAGPSLPGSRRSGLILPLILLSGVASFSYEVLWTRLLSQILGASIYAFATMLASFLVGITLGAAFAAKRATTRDRSARAFGWVQIGVGLASLGAFLAIDSLPAIAHAIGAGATSNLTANAMLAMIILLPGALCVGAAFPLAVRVLAQGEADAGPVSARVYTWNTVGAITGAIGAGFFILPWLSFAATLWAVVTLNLLIAAAASMLVRPVSGRVPLAAAVCIAGVAVLRPPEPWGVLRYSPLVGRADLESSISYFAVGKNTTVLLLDDGLRWQLRTGGLPEAAIARTAHIGPIFQDANWLASLAVLARPDADDVLIIGLGGGNAVSAVPSSVSKIDVIELEHEVVDANQAIADQRSHDPLGDPRVRLIVNDARGSLVLTDKRYDAIVSQPSHPWTSGASHLYTREFFELNRDHLNEGGVYVQWLGLPFVDEALLKSVVGSLCDVFQFVRVYQPLLTEIIFVASDSPLPVEESCSRAIASNADDFARGGIFTREDVAAALVLDERGSKQFSEGAPLITDDHNLLQMRSLHALREHRVRQEPARYFESYDPEFPDSLGLDWSYIVRRHLRIGLVGRAERYIQRITSPVEQMVAQGLRLAALDRQDEATLVLNRALEQNSTSATARFALCAHRRKAYSEDDAQAEKLADSAEDPYRAVYEGWRFQASDDWSSLRQLDGRLAMAGPLDDCFFEATRLRAAWRVHAQAPDLAREAMKLLDQLVVRFAETSDYFLRAEAALAAGSSIELLTTLHDALQHPDRGIPPAAIAASAKTLLDQVPQDPGLAEARRRIQQRIDFLKTEKR